jgi:hypothetical protein
MRSFTHRVRPRWGLRNGTGPESPPVEHRLVRLLAGTRDRRQATAAQIAQLASRSDPHRLAAVMAHLGMTVLLGGRLLELRLGTDPWLAEEIDSATAIAEQQGDRHELVTMGVLAALARADIRALPLKGSGLARQVHHSVAARTVGDIDILVAPEDLAGAIEAVEMLDYTWLRRISRASRLPILHEGLVHPMLPAVELHWRIHWYEDCFATDALRRAAPDPATHALTMNPADGLAALILFYARDGFSGLRMAADAAAWWDARCTGIDADTMLAITAERYPPLAGPLAAGAQLLRSLIGLPVSPRSLPFRWRVACELADPLLQLAPKQKNANASLTDVMLAPPGGVADALRRERQKVPGDLERPLIRADGVSPHLERAEHLLRVLRRWAITGPPALVRAVAASSTGRPEPY